MSRIATLASAVAIALLALFLVALGRNLIMPLAEAQEKGVGAGPWFLVWGMIAVTAVCSLSLVAFLLKTLGSPSRR